MRVLGVDPGLTRCGVGVVEGSIDRPLTMVDVGVLRTSTDQPIEERRKELAALLKKAVRPVQISPLFEVEPAELMEAARMDGAGSWRVLWEVVTPNLRGTIASLAILIFISTWNEYFWPLLLTRTPEHSVIQIGIQMFMTSEGTQWGALMAASTLASLPIFILYIVLQQQVVSSFMKSGIR